MVYIYVLKKSYDAHFDCSDMRAQASRKARASSTHRGSWRRACSIIMKWREFLQRCVRVRGYICTCALFIIILKGLIVCGMSYDVQAIFGLFVFEGVVLKNSEVLNHVFFLRFEWI